MLASSTVALASVSPAQAAEPFPPVVVPGGAAPYRPQGVIDASWKPGMPVTLHTHLGQSRIAARELSPLQQAFRGDKELYYPPFLLGAWNVQAELKRKIYPYGTNAC